MKSQKEETPEIANIRIDYYYQPNFYSLSRDLMITNEDPIDADTASIDPLVLERLEMKLYQSGMEGLWFHLKEQSKNDWEKIPPQGRNRAGIIPTNGADPNITIQSLRDKLRDANLTIEGLRKEISTVNRETPEKPDFEKLGKDHWRSLYPELSLEFWEEEQKGYAQIFAIGAERIWNDFVASKEGEGWIDVKERLPEPLADVLVWANTSLRPTTAQFMQGGDWFFRGSLESFRLSEQSHIKVTHWRPLPEPPMQKH